MDDNEDLENARKVLRIEDMIRWCDQKPFLIRKSGLAEKEFNKGSQPAEEVSNRLLETSKRLFQKETENAVQDKLYEMLKEYNYIEKSCYSETADEEERDFILNQIEQIATLSENIVPVQKDIDEAQATVTRLTLQLADLTKKRQAVQDQLNRSQQLDDETQRLKQDVADLRFNINMCSRMLTRLVLHCCKNFNQDQEMKELLLKLETNNI